VNRDHGSKERLHEAKQRELSRRDFVQRGGGALVAGAALGVLGGLPATLLHGEEKALKDARSGTIPRKVLGRTGIEVSILGLGTALLGHQNNNNPEIKKLIEVYSEALDRGITYVDTGRIYGRAEEALGTVVNSGGRRDKIFLATKVMEDERDKAEKSFEESLRLLKVEHVDVLHLHSTGDRDLDKVLAPGGLWDYFLKMKKEGKTRFLGITGHNRPLKFRRMLETDQVDVMMVAMNFVDRHIYGFEEKVLPVALKHKTGVMAMKVFGGVEGGFRNYTAKTPHPSQLALEHHRRSIAYAKSIEGLTGMVLGVHGREQLEENIRRVLEVEPLAKEDFDKLCAEGKAIAAGWDARFGPAA
jgi:hypothetical protein